MVTLYQLRRYWQRYITVSITEKSAVLSAMGKLKTAAKSGGYVLAALYAGPRRCSRASSALLGGWGSVEQCRRSRSHELNLITHVRETNFGVHYESDPVVSFRLAPAFVELSSSDSLSSIRSREVYGSGNLAARVADFAKSQFPLWSSSFRRKAKQTYVRLSYSASEVQEV